MIAQNGYLPVKELCRQLEVSEATARRDLTALEGEKRIKRTYGGAISEFDNRFPSFAERCGQAREAKAKIAAAALSFIVPKRIYFFDSGTTIFAIAEAFRENPIVPLVIVTSNIPVAEMLAQIRGVEVFLLAGQLLPRQAFLIGDTAKKSLEFWHFDTAFLSAEGMDAAGAWNSREAIVEQQKTVIRQSQLSVLCMDGSKLRQNAPHFLLPWNKVDCLLTDASGPRLKKAGVFLKSGQHKIASASQVPTQKGAREN